MAETGRVFHWQQPGRGQLPASMKMHAMISKHVGKAAQRSERLAEAEADAGHELTALEFYYDAAVKYASAQHTVFALNAEKQYLRDGVLRCYDQVRRQRGMHLFVFDGPGQGESNLRGIKLTLDNYERAASAALTHLIARPDVDEDRIGLYALSFGSYWGARFAATDHRIAAAALVWASICDKYYLFEEESPRYKQLFAFLTGLRSDAELDKFIAGMGLESLITDITCATLLTVGQYDPRSPVDQVYELFDRIEAPAELWVYADQHHSVNLRGSNAVQWYGDHHATTADWLRDRLGGSPVRYPGQTLYLEPNGVSPNDPSVPRRRHWFDDGGRG